MKITSNSVGQLIKSDDAYYRVLVENCPMAFIISRQEKVIYVNKACLNIFGYEASTDFRGSNMFEHIAPDCRDEIIDKVTRRFQGEAVPNCYATLGVKSDGTIFPFEVEVAKLDLPDGPATVAFISDITAHKNIENSLKKTEAKLRSITENSPDHIIMLDRKFNILFINYTIPEFTPEQIIGTSITDYVSSDFHLTIEKCLNRVLESGEPGKYETVYTDSKGNNIYYESLVGAIKNDDEVVALLINARDITETKLTKAALEKSEKKYRELVDEASSVIIRWDTQGNVTFFNEFAQKFFGFTEDEIVGKNVVGTIVPNTEFTGRDLVNLMEEIRKDPSKFEYNENENIKRNGERVWITWKNKPVFNEAGELIEILSVGIDSTQHKIAEDNIRESQKELKAILDSLQDTYYRVNKEGYVIRVSPSVEKLLGFTLEETLQIRLADLYVDHDGRDKFLQELAKHNGTISNYQARLWRKDGSIIWVSTNAHFCLDEQGNVIGIEGTTRDISEIIQFEDALRQSEERFRAIIERSASGIMLIDLQGHFVVTNKAVQEMLGYSATDLLEMSFANIFHSDDVEKNTHLQREVVSGISDHYKLEIRCIHKYGEIIWGSLNVSAIRNEMGDVSSLVCVLEDISDRKNMESALEQSTAKFKAIFNAISDAVIFVNTDRRIVMINPAVTKLFGFSLSELVNQTTERLYANRQDYIRQGQSRFRLDADLNQELYEVHYLRKDGSVFIGETFGTKIQDEQDNIIGFINITRDVSERKRIEERLRLSQKIFEDTAKAILVTDAAGNVIDMNKAFCDITGFNRADLIGMTLKSLQSHRHDNKFYKNMWELLNASGYWQGELWNKKHSGEEYPNWATISAVKDEQGNPNNYVAVFSDITAIKETEERLEQLAHYDQLTGLPNRMLFHDRLYSAVARAKRHNDGIAVMYIDLDGFKQVNDTLGHLAGDNLLKKIALQLKGCIRDEDTVARLGGDEFAIIINELQSNSFLQNLAKRVVGEIFTILSYEGRELRVSGSIGVATYPSDGTNEENLLRNADQAMYHAKQKGKNTYQFFDPQMNAKMMNRIHLESDLRHAIKNDELFIQYQPKYNLQKKQVVGFEALVRWHHPERGVVQPLDFIPLAEDSELIIELGKQVLEKACYHARGWNEAGHKAMPVAINISARQFKYEHFVQDIKQVLSKSGLPANLLEIEITESLLMEDIENTIVTLNELKSMGLSISIDDFGTGYSSLNYLKKLPVDILKIDKSFILDIVDDDDDRAIISAIISMAKSLNLRVIAEGVENLQQLEFLKSKRCHEIQGYYLGDPVLFEDIGACISAIEEKNLFSYT